MVKSKMAGETLFAFLATHRDGVPNMAEFDGDRGLMMEPGGVLIALPHEVFEAIKEIVVFAVLPEYNYGTVYGLSPFHAPRRSFGRITAVLAGFCMFRTQQK